LVEPHPDGFLFDQLDGNLGLAISPGMFDFSPLESDPERTAGGGKLFPKLSAVIGENPVDTVGTPSDQSLKEINGVPLVFSRHHHQKNQFGGSVNRYQ
jgi:hypothetical protein